MENNAVIDFDDLIWIALFEDIDAEYGSFIDPYLKDKSFFLAE